MSNLSKIFSLLFLINIAVKISDVIRSLLISSRLGVSSNADIYMAVMSVPDLILVLLGFDAIKGIVNSEYSSLHSSNKFSDLKISFSNLLVFLSLFGGIFVILAYFFRYQIIEVLLPGFNIYKKNSSVFIFLIILPIFFIRNLMNLFQSACNAYKKYYYPVFLPIIINIFIVTAVILFFSNENLIYYIAAASTLGNVTVAFILGIIVYHIIGGVKFSFKLDSVTIRILKSISSILILVTVNQIYFASRNFFASYLKDGSVSILNYANMPIGFITTFIFTVFFSVLLSELSSKFTIGDIVNARNIFFDTLISLLYFCIPLVLLMIIYKSEFLKLLYVRGNLKSEDIINISIPFFWETLTIIPFIFFILSVALYLASKNYLLITKIGSFVFIVGVVLNYIFSKVLGVYGISLANFVTSCIYALILFSFIRNIIGIKAKYLINIFKIILIGVVLFIIFLACKYYVFDYFESDSVLSQSLVLFIFSLLLFCVYYLCTSLLKVNYLKKVKGSIYYESRIN